MLFSLNRDPLDGPARYSTVPLGDIGSTSGEVSGVPLPGELMYRSGEEMPPHPCLPAFDPEAHDGKDLEDCIECKERASAF